jgi:hypothetical protein
VHRERVTLLALLERLERPLALLLDALLVEGTAHRGPQALHAGP